MNYEEFLNEAKETLTRLLSEDYPGISITTVDVEKMQNGSYRGLSVREEGKDVAMNMNLESLFEDVLEGSSKVLILGGFAREIRERLEDMPVFDIGELSNYDVMKENTLAFRMENQMPQLYICSDIHIQFECPAYHRMCECEHQIWRIDAPDFHFTQGGLYGHIPNSYEAVIV